MTDCPSSLPSAFSTATEMVSRWTSRPIYLMLSIGCSFREVWFTASHSNHNLLRKGRPFIMRAPDLALFRDLGGYDVRRMIPRVSKARDPGAPTNSQDARMSGVPVCCNRDYQPRVHG